MSPALEVVGRESEIDAVHEFLAAVPGGPIALLIEGEIGIGKRMLWREGIAEAGERGLNVLTSRPVEAEIALDEQRATDFDALLASLRAERVHKLVRSGRASRAFASWPRGSPRWS